MTIDAERVKLELVTVVRNKAFFNAEQKLYTTELDKPQKFSLESNFAQWLSQKLLFDGAHKERVKKNYKMLTLLFHPDRIRLATPEIAWIEKQLSDGRNHGACFAILTTCYEKLIHPELFKPIHVNDVRSKDDFRRWLEQEKEKSRLGSTQALYQHLLNLLNEFDLFFDTTGTLQPRAVRVLVQLIPALITTYGASLVIEQLFAVYLLYFFVLKGGRQLKDSDREELQAMGGYIQQYASTAATVNTILLAYFIEMIFWSSRHCFNYSVQLGAQLLTSLPANDECEILLLPQELQLNRQRREVSFQHPELQLIATPFEKYLAMNKAQYLGDWQLSRAKSKAIKRFLFHLHVCDQKEEPIADKLPLIKEWLNQIKNERHLYTSKTAAAVDYAEQLISALEAGIVPGVVAGVVSEENSLQSSSFFK
ncbi:MAG: hypothetical protein CK426_02765 [Legionella sp.]|nr:MAG: hypothetical protein CK423_08620 [Legionella sp.]PJD99454.1 MAG: hypothetical protein CK426_02765 [Legionella sp.]